MQVQIKVSLLALLALGACKDSSKGSEGDKVPSAAKSAAKPAGPLKIEKFGLQMDVPAGTKVSEMAGTQMIQGPGLVVSVEKAGDFSPKTLTEQLSEIKDMYSGSDVTKEKLEGGWHVTFINKGGMGKNYWVASHLTIDGTAYTCGTTASSAKQQASALAACKSLRK